MNSIKINKISLLLLILLLSGSVFLSGCGKEDANEKTEEEQVEEVIPTVETFTVVSSDDIGEVISLSGTLVAKEEITIASEASGTVSKVTKKEGESIENGDKIMILEANTNLLNASYAAAKAAFHNASAVLSLTRQSAARDTENAKIAVTEARIAEEKVKNAEQFILSSSSSQRKSAEKTLEISQKNLTIAETALAQVSENEQKIQKNLLQNTSNTLSRVFVDFRSILRTSDELISASELNRDTNKEFEIYLIGTSQGIMLPTQDLWKKNDRSISALEDAFRIIEKKEYNTEDEEALLESLSQGKFLSRDMRTMLRNIEEMLNKSIPSKTFSAGTIANLKEQNRQQQLLLESNISAMTGIEQSLSDFHIQSPQRVINSELNISVAQTQVASAENALENVVSADGLTKVNQSSDISAAAQRLRAAEVSLSSTQSRGALSIQSANAQYDSAKAALTQAEISLSKLVITAGVSGTVSQIMRHDGDTVSPGTPLVVVADFSQLKLEGDVSLSESFLLKKGMKAIIEIEGIEKPVEGKISLVAPQADKITRRVAIEITISNKDKIPANIFATAKISLPKGKEKVIIIPNTSIVQEGDISHVYVLIDSEGKKNLEKRIIMREEEETSNNSKIISGVLVGEKIVMSPKNTFFTGQEVLEKGIEEEKEKIKPSVEGEKVTRQKSSPLPSPSSSPTASPDIMSTQEAPRTDVSTVEVS